MLEVLVVILLGAVTVALGLVGLSPFAALGVVLGLMFLGAWLLTEVWP